MGGVILKTIIILFGLALFLYFSRIFWALLFPKHLRCKVYGDHYWIDDKAEKTDCMFCEAKSELIDTGYRSVRITT